MSELVPSRSGLKARSCDLWVDARRATPCSFVSHAHADHAARHGQAIATAATLALLARRLRRGRTVTLPAPFGRPFTYGPLKLELLPAGHVLGSAQLRIEAHGHRTVYTGDLNTARSLTAEPLELARCDTLVIEATFGHPRHRFPPRARIHERMARFAERALEARATPVFFAHALGKAQEAARILGERGFRVRLHADAWKLAEVYLAHGVRLPLAAPLAPRPEPGEVIVAPLRLVGSRLLGRRGELRTCVLTGWAQDPEARPRAGVDEAMPLSDHADFEGLVEYARATGAGEVLTVHGDAETLARELRGRGIAARPLEPGSQLRLL